MKALGASWIKRELQLRILNAVKDQDNPILRFMLEADLRPSEVRSLRWCGCAGG